MPDPRSLARVVLSRTTSARPASTCWVTASASPTAVEPLGQRGYVLVWMSLLLVVLVGFAGFGVDTANLWFTGQKMQKAADAAALAGVVFLPGDLADGVAQAIKVAAQNGYTNGSNGDVVTPTQDPNNPDRLDVTITHTQKTIFVGVFGIKQQTLHRSAVAEYEGPVPMGSPTNNLGNQPNWTGGPARRPWPAGSSLTTAQQHEPTRNPDCGATTSPARSTDKINGDQASAPHVLFADRGRVQLPQHGQHRQQRVPGGQHRRPGRTATTTSMQTNVVVGRRPSPSQRLSIQVYDPAFMDTGNTCDQAESTNSPERPEQARPPTAPPAPAARATNRHVHRQPAHRRRQRAPELGPHQRQHPEHVLHLRRLLHPGPQRRSSTPPPPTSRSSSPT